MQSLHLKNAGFTVPTSELTGFLPDGEHMNHLTSLKLALHTRQYNNWAKLGKLSGITAEGQKQLCDISLCRNAICLMFTSPAFISTPPKATLQEWPHIVNKGLLRSYHCTLEVHILVNAIGCSVSCLCSTRSLCYSLFIIVLFPMQHCCSASKSLLIFKRDNHLNWTVFSSRCAVSSWAKMESCQCIATACRLLYQNLSFPCELCLAFDGEVS